MGDSMDNGAANTNPNNEGGRVIMANGTIKTMEAFAGTVKGVMEAVYGNGYSVGIQPVTRNNGTRLTGLTIREDGISIAATVYLDGLFARYQDGMALEVMGIYGQHKEAQFFDSRMVTDFNQAKERICFKLVNAGKNRELLAGIPYIPYHDLAVVFYVLVSKGMGGVSTVLVRNSFMGMWGTDTQTLYNIAMENT